MFAGFAWLYTEAIEKASIAPQFHEHLKQDRDGSNSLPEILKYLWIQLDLVNL